MKARSNRETTKKSETLLSPELEKWTLNKQKKDPGSNPRLSVGGGPSLSAKVLFRDRTIPGRREPGEEIWLSQDRVEESSSNY